MPKCWSGGGGHGFQNLESTLFEYACIEIFAVSTYIRIPLQRPDEGQERYLRA